ncbi:hypothetical protein BDV11DRAFT_166133 [Aspergillus similis]
MLLRRNDVDIDIDHPLDSEPNEGPPLCKAALRGHVRLVQLLLEHGAAVDCRDGGRATPLTLNVGAARIWRSERIIRLLPIEAGADVNAWDEMGHMPLWYAAKTTRRTWEYLLEQGGMQI